MESSFLWWCLIIVLMYPMSLAQTPFSELLSNPVFNILGNGGGGNHLDYSKLLDGVESLTMHSGDHQQHPQSNISTFGYSDIPSRIDMDHESRFPIASNSKLFTTVAIYQLSEQGKFNLDDDIASLLDRTDFVKFGWGRRVRKLCPRLPYRIKCERITLRQLLSMSSGIYPELNCNARASTNDQCDLIPYLINRGSIALTVGSFLNEPLVYEPGTQYQYSNPNFVLASYLVEKYSNMTFRDYLQEYIFSPIGLKDTYFDFFNQAVRVDPKRVRQYFKYYDKTGSNLLSVGEHMLQLDAGSAAGTGGLISTIQDQATFWYSLFNQTTKGSPLLQSPSSQAAILQPWTLMGKGQFIWGEAVIDIWQYYTQGVTIICTKEKCPNGPRWISYGGSVISVLTSNMMDYHTGVMSQIWVNSIMGLSDNFQDAFDKQIGQVQLGQWMNETLSSPEIPCIIKLFTHSPPTTTDDSREAYGERNVVA